MATDKIGLRFSTIPYSFANPCPINNSAHYYCPTILNDSLNWVQLKGSYVADSAYQYVAIGNFFDDVNMFSFDTLGMSNCNNWQAYYFLDNVAVSSDSNIAYATGVNEYDEFQWISLFPNPCANTLNIICNEIPKQIEVYDMLGDLCLKSNFSFKSSIYLLDTSELNSGIYIVKISVQKKIIQKKIVISKY